MKAVCSVAAMVMMSTLVTLSKCHVNSAHPYYSGYGGMDSGSYDSHYSGSPLRRPNKYSASLKASSNPVNPNDMPPGHTLTVTLNRPEGLASIEPTSFTLVEQLAPAPPPAPEPPRFPVPASRPRPYVSYPRYRYMRPYGRY